MKTDKKILDACCGGRMFWFDKKHPDALYVDNRTMERQVIWQDKGGCRPGRRRMFEIQPDAVMDFRKLDLPDRTFHFVVFDPPHLRKRNGKTGWMNKKYGSLDETWREDLRKGFAECFRVLKKNGVLVFKWSESEIPLRPDRSAAAFRSPVWQGGDDALGDFYEAMNEHIEKILAEFDERFKDIHCGILFDGKRECGEHECAASPLRDFLRTALHQAYIAGAKSAWQKAIWLAESNKDIKTVL